LIYEEEDSIRKIDIELSKKVGKISKRLITKSHKIKTRNKLATRMISLLKKSKTILRTVDETKKKEFLETLTTDIPFLEKSIKELEHDDEMICNLQSVVNQFHHEIMNLLSNRLINSMQELRSRTGQVWVEDRRLGGVKCGFECISQKPSDGPKKKEDSVILPRSLWDS